MFKEEFGEGNELEEFRESFPVGGVEKENLQKDYWSRKPIGRVWRSERCRDYGGVLRRKIYGRSLEEGYLRERRRREGGGAMFTTDLTYDSGVYPSLLKLLS